MKIYYDIVFLTLIKNKLPGFVPIMDLSSCHLGILGSSV